MHPYLYVIALLALGAVGAGLAWGHGLSPAARWHVVFAMGALPLILAAMLYFVPVLTRRPPAGGAVRVLPWLAWFAAFPVVLGIARYPLWRLPLALICLLVVVTMLEWVRRQARSGLSSPHPGLYWYVGALLCLLAGLAAIAAALLWPAQWIELRRFHLHMNLFGFVGMTAWGTLRVLLPTVHGASDAHAGPELRQGWIFALAGTWLIAAGAAWWPILTWPGAVLWMVPSLRWLSRLISRGEGPWQGWHAAATALWSAMIAFACMPLLGLWHARGGVSGALLLELFLLLFLCPLLIGASSYLLPVWRWPGASHGVLQAARRRLMRGIGVRAMGLLVAAALHAGGSQWGMPLAALVLITYLMQVMLGLRVQSPG